MSSCTGCFITKNKTHIKIKQKKKYIFQCLILNITNVYVQTRIPEMLGRFLNFNKMKTKRISNHMSHSQYTIANIKPV